MRGIDIAGPVDPVHTQRLKAAGYGFVAGYFSYNTRKNLTRTEVVGLSQAGIAIVSVWEAVGSLAAAFSADQGAKDAAAALRLAQVIGQPEGSAIYFAVDFDASSSEIETRIAPYFRSVNAVLKDHYRIGVYGSGLVCGAMRDQGLIDPGLMWLGGAGGWSGSRNFTGYAIKQGLPSRVAGLSVDPDVANDGDFGQWMAVPPTGNLQGNLAGSPDDPVDLIKRAQKILGVVDDGDPGPMTRKALTDWRDAHPA